MKIDSSIREVRSHIFAGRLTLPGLLDQYLSRIRERQHLNAFIEVFSEEAASRANVIQEKILAGTAGKLAGLIIGLKDNICFKDHRVAAASRMLDGFVSVYSATVVERLLQEDAIIIGRLNCDEFAMGASNETSFFGPVLNAADTSRVPGGSSGGSAVAVQAGLCQAALGTDTGGSVRQPAAFCGVVGLKPSYGRVSRNGIIAYASSFDQVGPLTHSVEDAALILEVIAGADPADSTSSAREVPAYSSLLEFKGKAKIAYLKEAFESPGLDEGVRSCMESQISRLRELGHTAEACDFPYLDFVVPAYYILTMAEASSNLARYDGVHYGYRSPSAENLESTYKKSRTEGFGEEVKRRIMLGTFVLSAGYYDAYYSKAQKVRRLIRDALFSLLENYDFILLPTAPTPAFGLGEKTDDPIVMYLADIFTVQASLAGLPAISIPAGAHPDGLPVGLQLIGRKFGEQDLLAFANSNF
ncbi:aspartyl/glutamyl-tRNA(Asn/Gln) amidotransferase subunit A [Anseongella ginsenosidimutans]|uniref:Glutamyl-tRNA(Gln) amidotransferase subunit A n=1 Tax=Anseongella ginsenosidimutans TaxID=496056 RepID=A0A4R3KXV7_9SPHI|nr:Asp-tRNA(Asn)/Glu-tRNA(Gln) amidotransferase subunit GatA [Anseongella ginsenosidimutans]TCS90318.1 aspartyl/glutamyl-tRNA(Asn/Gln) amidotransferase subunit A [Anseongella ginsenosidimutans]